MAFSALSAVVKTFAGNGKNCTKNGPVGTSSLAMPSVVCPIPHTTSILIADALTVGLRVADESQLDTLQYSGKCALNVAGMCVPPHTENIVFVADRVHSKIRRLNLKNLELSTIAGCTEGYNDGPLAAAKFNEPTAIETASDGRLLVVCDTGNRVIRCIDFENGEVSTLCGVSAKTGKIPLGLTVDLKKARFNKIVALEVSAYRRGIIYVVDEGNHCVIELDTMRETAKVILGMPGTPGKIEIDGMQLLCAPSGICELPGMELLVCDTGNNCLRLIEVQDEYKSVLLNTHLKPKGYKLRIGEKLIREANRFKRGWVDGNIFQAMFFAPTDCRFDGRSIYIVDKGNNVIRIIDYGIDVASKFDDEKLLKSTAFYEENEVPRVYCRKCQLQCRVWNGRSCDRCGSCDIFALKPSESASTDAPYLKNSIKNDIMHQIYFKKQLQDGTFNGSALLCDAATAGIQETLADVDHECRPEQNTDVKSDSFAHSTTQRASRGPQIAGTIRQTDDGNLEVCERNAETSHLHYFKTDLQTTDPNVERLMQKVKQSEQKLQELEEVKRELLEPPAAQLSSLVSSVDTKEVALAVAPKISEDPVNSFVDGQVFAPQLSYELQLEPLCAMLYDLQVDEDQYLQDLLECPFKDDFMAFNLLEVSPRPEDLLEFVERLKSVAPITLAVYAFEGDDAFPVPLIVNKQDAFTQFVDTEATTVCLAILGDLQPSDVFVRLKTSENRQIFQQTRLHDSNPLCRLGCENEVIYSCQGNLADLLKMSKISHINEYCCTVVFEFADESQLSFEVAFGCGSAHEIRVDGADLLLLEALSQLEIVRPTTGIQEQM